MRGNWDVLKRTDFSGELRTIYGGAYDSLNNDSKEILESIFHHNEFGSFADVSANLIGNHLFFTKHSALNIDVKVLGNFKRKVRNTINKLEKNGYIRRKQEAKPDYEVNVDFQRIPSLFDKK